MNDPSHFQDRPTAELKYLLTQLRPIQKPYRDIMAILKQREADREKQRAALRDKLSWQHIFRFLRTHFLGTSGEHRQR